MQKIFELTYKSVMIFQLIATLCFLYLLCFGTTTQWIIALTIYSVRIVITTSIIHRKLAHRAFNTPKWIEYTLSTLCVSGGHSSVITWVAVHRQHHRFPDVEKDPHSPQHHNILKIHFQRVLKMPSMMYVPDLVKSKFYIASHRWHWLIGLGFMSVLYLIDPMAIVYAWFVPLFLHWHAGSLVNSLNHLNVGYRNHNTKDFSNNHFFTGYLAAGEGWHNNHHNNPSNPKFGEKWWELDIGWWFIKLIRST